MASTSLLLHKDLAAVRLGSMEHWTYLIDQIPREARGSSTTAWSIPKWKQIKGGATSKYSWHSSPGMHGDHELRISFRLAMNLSNEYLRFPAPNDLSAIFRRFWSAWLSSSCFDLCAGSWLGLPRILPVRCSAIRWVASWSMNCCCGNSPLQASSCGANGARGEKRFASE